MDKRKLFSKLPSVDEVLGDSKIVNIISEYPRDLVIEGIREAIDINRKSIINLKENIHDFDISIDDIVNDAICRVRLKYELSLKKVINATGVVIHTNLGRSLLSESIKNEVLNTAFRYSNLEYDIDKGERGSRYSNLTETIKRITNAEDVLVVNNNAAAVLLVLSTLAKSKEAIVSRGELVEVGGSFRIPSIMELSGAKLVDVGATNKTHLNDYEEAINEETGVLMKVHTSNYKILGFTESVEIRELKKLGKKYNLPVIEDLGSGVFIDLSKYGLSYEPTVLDSLKNGADIVITGRVADPSLSLGPLVYEFGWSMDDYEKLGKGTWVGHLLECAGQVTGGYFADPGYKDVPELWNLGFPIIEVDENGDGVVSKLSNTGGIVTTETVKEQSLYEIQDPENYFTPDVIADFSKITVKQIGENEVKIENASGKVPNGYYKTSVGYHDCYISEGQISYGGSNALAKAKLAREILEHRFEMIGLKAEEVRFDYIGVNSLYKDSISNEMGQYTPNEVRLRVAARVKTKAEAELIGNEVEALYTNGPSGGGGAVKTIKDIVSIASILIPSDHFHITVGYLEV